MQDVTISPALLRQMGDAYRRIRNTFKFLLGNLYDFDPRDDAVALEQLQPLDRYMLHRLEELRAEAQTAYERYEFYRVFHLLHNFCAVDLSARYCDILKDTLYVEAGAGARRRSAQTALWELALALTKLAAPILAFTCDEVWDHLAARALGDNGATVPSVHLALMPAPRPERLQPRLAAQFDQLWRVRDDVLRALEALRKRGAIGAGLDADVALWTDDTALTAVLHAHAASLPRLFIVSRVEVAAAAGPEWQHGHTLPTLRLDVRPARGRKCARCWNYTDDVDAGAAPTDVCQRCRNVMRGGAADAISI